MLQHPAAIMLHKCVEPQAVMHIAPLGLHSCACEAWRFLTHALSMWSLVFCSSLGLSHFPQQT